MSFFFLTQADRETRISCRERGGALVDQLELSARCELHLDSGLLLGAAPHKAVLQTHTSETETALLLGYALDEEGRPFTPERLAKRWKAQPAFQPDGFFLAAVLRTDGGITVAVDPLGLYPCLYTQLPDGSWLLASAARDLYIHPDFRAKPDLEGVSGQLLLNSPLDNRTVLQDVRLIPARTVLHLRKGAPPQGETAALPAPERPATREDALDLFTQHWSRAMRNHLAVTEACASDLLLSGGRDSRMVAASLEKAGFAFRPVTFGLRGEYEVQAARAVSRTLKTGKMLLLRDEDPAWLLQAWETRARRSAGLGGGTFGGLMPHPALNPWMHHGILLDDLVGGYAARFSWDTGAGLHRGALFYEKLNRWGFPAETLRSLFKDADAGELGFQLRDRMLADFERRADEADQASFDWKLATRCRHHLGIALWEFTRHTWPVVPGCDQALYAFVRSLPLEWVNGRSLQSAWMRSECPDLLRIPFDDNTHRFVPDQPGWRWPAWRRRLFAPDQPLRYHRVFGMDTPAWRAVAKEAEAARAALHAFLDPGELKRLWPEDLTALTPPNPFASLAGMRSLMVLAGFFAQGDL